MTQEEKDLLFKDLSARLPYGVKVQCGDYLFTFDKDHISIGMLYTDFNRNPLKSPKIILSGCYYGEDIKPYLVPIESMTEEQKLELATIKTYVSLNKNKEYLLFDWLNANHFDYRCLIEKGLALDATGLNIY